MYHLGTPEMYVAHVQVEALRDAEHERLVRLALGPGKPIRARVAEWLHALAARVDQPLQVEAEAALI